MTTIATADLYDERGDALDSLALQLHDFGGRAAFDGPVRTIRLRDGAWGEFQKRRLAKSGGTVEQYKQPHLIPDPNEIGAFPALDSVAP